MEEEYQDPPPINLSFSPPQIEKRTMEDYAQPSITRVQSSIARPPEFVALQQDDQSKVDSEEVHTLMDKLDEPDVEKKTAKKEDLKEPPRPSLKSSLEEPPESELKPLSNHLKHAFLRENSTLLKPTADSRPRPTARSRSRVQLRVGSNRRPLKSTATSSKRTITFRKAQVNDTEIEPIQNPTTPAFFPILI
ncbi:hypothetical protein M9H77_31273 [Catharanthus roseus]|uniref:Uncharacterized protein n=1 Tax=Catharanthus roseus TaxID=4058 RepID=A0ACC0A000_CATRO|nr:hypothetical protein M9H77_31273 [Catharanthus roseus]